MIADYQVYRPFFDQPGNLLMVLTNGAEDPRNLRNDFQEEPPVGRIANRIKGHPDP